MALRALMAGKKLREAQKRLEEARAKITEMKTREAELETAIEEAETEEEKAAVEEEVSQFETEKTEAEQAVTDLEAEVEKLERELKEIEETPAEEKKPEERKAETPQKEVRTMSKRWREMATHERAAIVNAEGVQAWLGEVRSMMRGEKRGIQNVGQTIPQEVLPILKQNVYEASKLLKHVNLVRVSGEARQVIQGDFPEGIWTDCCANLNELDLTFYGTEVNCWKIAGFFALCNANIEDSDEDLLADVLQAIGQSLGLGVDKAILYGTGTRMPLGIMTRLVQTSKPAGYSDDDRPWVDLHTSNIKSISASIKGEALFQELVMDSGAAYSDYSTKDTVWVMNRQTYTFLKAQGLSVNAAGAIVSGVEGTLPVVGGKVEILNFVPNNVIIGGYFELYLMAERAGAKFATSEHVRFLQDQTVAKGTARYDGKPVIAEAFVAIGLNGVTPDADMTFAPDSANF